MTQTFTSLDKDIRFTYKGHGKYDRCMLGDDYDRVEGIESLQTAIKLAIITGYGELSNNPTFKNFGNKAWLLLKQVRNEMLLLNVKEYFKECVEKISRVKSVDLVELYEDSTNPTQLFVKIVVTSTDDSTVRTEVIV